MRVPKYLQKEVRQLEAMRYFQEKLCAYDTSLILLTRQADQMASATNDIFGRRLMPEASTEDVAKRRGHWLLLSAGEVMLRRGE